MTYAYRISDTGAMHFITCTVVQWAAVFTRNMYVEIVEYSFHFCIDNKGLMVYGYVMMSHRIHLLLQAEGNHLSDGLHDFIKFGSQRIIRAIEENDKESRKQWLLWLLTSDKAPDERSVSFRFWQPDNDAELCFGLPFMWQKPDSFPNNPVRLGIVEKAEEYRASVRRITFTESQWEG